MRSITKKIGKMCGKTVAIIGGVHGNWIYANPEAIRKNVRAVNKNLNRCFIAKNKGLTPEDIRARTLMRILDRCDAVLDIHASNSHKSTPFIICEKEAFEIARKMDFSIISFGWDIIEPGAIDGYMHYKGKPGLCLECGSVFDKENNLDLAIKSILQFLYYFGLTKSRATYNQEKKTFIKVYKAIKKETERFLFVSDYNDFDSLTPGQVFAVDGLKNYIAKQDDIIIFPRARALIGGEAFILGREMPSKKL